MQPSTLKAIINNQFLITGFSITTSGLIRSKIAFSGVETFSTPIFIIREK